MDLLDYYAAGWPYLFIGLCEFIIIGYVYGVQNYFDDLYHMTKLNPGMWGKSHLVFLYMTLSPLIIFVSFLLPLLLSTRTLHNATQCYIWILISILQILGNSYIFVDWV